MAVGFDNSGPRPEVDFAFNARGTVTFDGATNPDGTGNYIFAVVDTDGEVQNGTDKYDVNASGNGRIDLLSTNGAPIQALASGANLDTLIGISVGDPDYAQIIIATKRN